MNSSLKDLLIEGPVAINLGLRELAESLQKQAVRVIHVDWSPAPQLDDETAALLDRLL